jgi:hypothetical protein
MSLRGVACRRRGEYARLMTAYMTWSIPQKPRRQMLAGRPKNGIMHPRTGEQGQTLNNSQKYTNYFYNCQLICINIRAKVLMCVA